MIRIITGGINSGKTCKLMQLHSLYPGEGYALIKRPQGAGQDIIRLSDKKIMPFSRTEGHLPAGWDGVENFDRFSFSGNGINFAKQIIKDIISNGAKYAYIDEIGPLELSGKGVDKEFHLLTASIENVTFTIRNTCLKDCLLRYFHKYDLEIYYV